MCTLVRLTRCQQLLAGRRVGHRALGLQIWYAWLRGCDGNAHGAACLCSKLSGGLCHRRMVACNKGSPVLA